jgi:hypothetical protein
MILIGDENIEYETMQKITTVADITSTTSNSTVLYNFDFDILKYAKQNNINSAVISKNLQEVIYAATFNVRYIIVKKNIVKEAQNIANNYMLDSKVLVIIDSCDEIVENAIDEIDGVIYKTLVE